MSKKNEVLVDKFMIGLLCFVIGFFCCISLIIGMDGVAVNRAGLDGLCVAEYGVGFVFDKSDYDGLYCEFVGFEPEPEPEYPLPKGFVEIDLGKVDVEPGDYKLCVAENNYCDLGELNITVKLGDKYCKLEDYCHASKRCVE